MANKIFVTTVTLLWLSSMAWLVSVRILPSLGTGEPPVSQDYQTGKCVAWQVRWYNPQTAAQEPIGQAASVRLAAAAGGTDLYKRLTLVDLPLLDLAPSWLRLTPTEIDNLSLDATTRLEFDAQGQFSGLQSWISLGDLPSALELSGCLQDSYLELEVRAGGLTYRAPVYLPNSQAFREMLFPAFKLPGLRVGQTWREEVYSPFRRPDEPVELVEAEVVGIEQLSIAAARVRTLRVEYRSVNGSGLSKQARLLAVSWVEPAAGVVLKREVMLGTTKLIFERVSSDEAAAIGETLFAELVQHEQGLSLPSP